MVDTPTPDSFRRIVAHHLADKPSAEDRPTVTVTSEIDEPPSRGRERTITLGEYAVHRLAVPSLRRREEREERVVVQPRVNAALVKAHALAGVEVNGLSPKRSEVDLPEFLVRVALLDPQKGAGAVAGKDAALVGAQDVERSRLGATGDSKDVGGIVPEDQVAKTNAPQVAGRAWSARGRHVANNDHAAAGTRSRVVEGKPGDGREITTNAQEGFSVGPRCPQRSERARGPYELGDVGPIAEQRYGRGRVVEKTRGGRGVGDFDRCFEDVRARRQVDDPTVRGDSRADLTLDARGCWNGYSIPINGRARHSHL